MKLLKSENGNPREDTILLKPFHYISSLPGKQIRTKLALAFNHWLKVPRDTTKRICEIVELLHNASLLIDDIQDGSELRRGQPVAHAMFGVPRTINSAHYACVIAVERALKLQNQPEVAEVLTSQLLELHRGQGMEIYWRDSFQCPTETQYREQVVKKTGGLFILAVRLLQIFSEDKRDFTKLVSSLGLFFQIRDDYINLTDPVYCENKSFCEDLTEGKFSFPVIHAISSHPKDTQVKGILKQRTKSVESKKYFVSLLTKFGSLSYTESVLKELEMEIREEIEEFGGNPRLIALVDELSTSKEKNHNSKNVDRRSPKPWNIRSSMKYSGKQLQKRLNGIKQRLRNVLHRFSGVKQRSSNNTRPLNSIKQRLRSIKQRFHSITQRLNTIRPRFGNINLKQHLDEIKQSFGTIKQRFGSGKRRFDSIEHLNSV